MPWPAFPAPLDHNTAIGGNGDSASGGRVAHVGSGLGGAIDSSYGSDGLNGDYTPNTLAVTNRTITQNACRRQMNYPGQYNRPEEAGKVFFRDFCRLRGPTYATRGDKPRENNGGRVSFKQ